MGNGVQVYQLYDLSWYAQMSCTVLDFHHLTGIFCLNCFEIVVAVTGKIKGTKSAGLENSQPEHSK